MQYVFELDRYTWPIPAFLLNIISTGHSDVMTHMKAVNQIVYFSFINHLFESFQEKVISLNFTDIHIKTLWIY